MFTPSSVHVLGFDPRMVRTKHGSMLGNMHRLCGESVLCTQRMSQCQQRICVFGPLRALVVPLSTQRKPEKWCWRFNETLILSEGVVRPLAISVGQHRCVQHLGVRGPNVESLHITHWYYLETSSNGLKDFLMNLGIAPYCVAHTQHTALHAYCVCESSTQVQNRWIGNDAQPIARLSRGACHASSLLR